MRTFIAVTLSVFNAELQLAYHWKDETSGAGVLTLLVAALVLCIAQDFKELIK